MSEDCSFTLTPTTGDICNVLQLSSRKTTVSFRFMEGPLTAEHLATQGDKDAYMNHHWQGILDVLYELAGRKDIQAMFEKRGLKVERHTK